ncbi:3-hydroxyacyl-CoA dehydrogenase NAD-binding domain-containing protein [Knoellia sp. S7-12]|uniref:3-hydroxyacyl-CoA dehydrogenase family protein n=1 Tax=Knoellia sp. S7-12 TaxID=3126698 RepID=UPI003366C4AC
MGKRARTLDLGPAMDGADLVVEAVTERLDVKAAVLREISSTNQAVPIASNTSTYQPSELQALITVPERLLVAHFFNPADVVPLVEVVPGPLTSPGLVQDMVTLMQALGKRPVVLSQECPGFVANRLQAALLREAFALVERGIVGVEELDAIVRDSLGPRWAVAGPFRTADLGGLDVFEMLCTQLFPDLDGRRTAPDGLRGLVAEGRLGAKVNAGLFTYGPGEAEEMTSRISAAFVATEASSLPEAPRA